MRILYTILFVLSFGCSFGQGLTYPKIQGEGKSISDFIPKGWKLLKSSTGDLNKDKKADAALVIQHIDSVTIVTQDGEYFDTVITQPRMLLIAFKDSLTNGYRLVEQNTSFILNHERANQDDPLQSVKIQNGFLQIDYYIFYSAGTWYVTNTSYKFRYQNNEFVLIGADYYSFHRASKEFEKASYNFLTKRYSLTTGIDKPGKKPVTEWKTLHLPQLKTLKTFKQPFSWQVTEDIYI